MSEQHQLSGVLCGSLHGEADGLADGVEGAAEALEALGLDAAAAEFRALSTAARELSDNVSAACGVAQESYEARYGAL